MSVENGNVGRARALLAAIERGDVEGTLACYAADAVQIEHPNRLKPQGDRRGAAQLAADSERGKSVLRRQSYRVANLVADGDNVAMQVEWEGELAIALGSLQPGDSMRAVSAMFLRFADGLIVEQHNYDCFDAF